MDIKLFAIARNTMINDWKILKDWDTGKLCIYDNISRANYAKRKYKIDFPDENIVVIELSINETIRANS